MPDSGQLSTGHKLHLMKYHKRKQEVIIQLTEDGQHHGRADSKTFLGATKNDGDAVLTAEAHPEAAVVGGGKGDTEENTAHENQPQKIA